MTKKCNKCGRELPLDEFGNDAQKYDGKQWWCKECMEKARQRRQQIALQGRKTRLVEASTKDLLHELMFRLNPLKGIFS